MRESFELMPFVIGGILGVALTAIALYFIKRKGQIEKRYDERYNMLQYQSRSLAWGVTTLTLVIAFTILYIMEGYSLATFLVLLVYLLHVGVQIIYYQHLKKRS